MKKILIISGSDLNDLTNGSTTVLRNYLKYIPEDYKITILNNIVENKEIIKDLSNENIRIINIEKKNNEFKKFLKYFPLICYAYLPLAKNKKILERIKKISFTQDYDLIYFHGATSYTECYLKGIKGKLVINLIDLYSYAYKKYFLSEKNLIKKIFCLKEEKLAQQIEKKIINEFQKVILVNSNEKDYANKIYKTNKFEDVPIGIDIDEKKIIQDVNLKIKKEINLVFIGNMNFKPNLDGINKFYNEFFSKLDLRYRLHIIGPNSQKLLFEDSRVKKYGFVENLDLLLNNMDFGIAIMENGGGQKNKILDYLSRGIPVIANEYTYRNNKFESKYIYIANNHKEIDDLIETFFSCNHTKKEIIESIKKYSAKNSAIKFWELIKRELMEGGK